MDNFTQAVLPAESLPSPHIWSTTTIFTTCVCVFFAIGIFHAKRNSYPELPELNPRHAFEFTDTRRIRRFMRNTLAMFEEGKSKFLNKPYKLFCDLGEVVVLPHEFVTEIKSDRRFEFSESASEAST